MRKHARENAAASWALGKASQLHCHTTAWQSQGCGARLSLVGTGTERQNVARQLKPQLRLPGKENAAQLPPKGLKIKPFGKARAISANSNEEKSPIKSRVLNEMVIM